MSDTLRPPSAAIVRQILLDAADTPDLSRERLQGLARERIRGSSFQLPTVKSLWSRYRDLVRRGELKASPAVEQALRVKGVRTDSGVAPITVLTKPYPCPGTCVYCPTEARMPKSYVASEPAAARALMLRFDPFDQVTQRVQALERNGHDAQKIELIIKGGTWSSYRWEYRKWFIKRCFDAANQLNASKVSSKKKTRTTLAKAQTENERASHRIIGLTIETRPDWVTAQEVVRLRELGCTRVELGVQTLQDDVLMLTKRGHTIEATVRAIALLKQAGFKTDFHILPGQPGSSVERDIKDFETLFTDARFRPDMIKLYPCVVLPSTEIQAWAERGEFKALEGNELKELLITMQTLVPRYCRISRLIRDFPDHEISFGNKVTNLREQLEAEMERRGTPCQCLRCREVGHVIKRLENQKQKPSDAESLYTAKPELFEEWYDNAGGREVFLTMEDPARRAVFAFLRLRLPMSQKEVRALEPYANDKRFIQESTKIEKAFPLFKQTAFVRELHSYGTALSIDERRSDAAQHKGYGKRLMKRAEEIAKREGFSHLSVISGIGVREYYRGLGYRLRESYLVKKLG